MMNERLPERLMPLATRLGLRPYYGDIHNHCALSYGHGTLEEALKRARRQLDFVSVTGHAYWPDMPVDDPRVAHIVNFHIKGFAKLERAWPGHFALLEAFDAPGTFTVFPGYEIHSCEYGDYTIVYRDLDQRELLKADSPAELRQRLEARYAGRAFAFPHHIGYRQGARGINWSAFDERLSPVLEMISMHGCSEASMGDRPFLHSMGPSDGRSTVHYGLGKGHIFGLIGNTDHHSGYPGSYGHGRSCVYAHENTRDALWAALHDRRTNALTGDCTHLMAAIDGVAQGGIVGAGADLMEIEAVGGSFIDFIDVIHNTRLVSRITPALAPRAIESADDMTETILVVELGWGARGKAHDWTGVIDLIDGDILAVEPRLRGPEIVSPLEGEAEAADEDLVECTGNTIRFHVRAWANPNNVTAATQAIAARVRVGGHSRIRADFDGQIVEVAAPRLFEGALSGNLGPIDSPAYRFHPLPLPHEWQWHGRIPIPAMQPGDNIYVRMRQTSGQWTWASPIFCR